MSGAPTAAAAAAAMPAGGAAPPHRPYQWQPAPPLPQTLAMRAALAKAAANGQTAAATTCGAQPAQQQQQQQSQFAGRASVQPSAAAGGAAAAAAQPPAQHAPWRPAAPAPANPYTQPHQSRQQQPAAIGNAPLSAAAAAPFGPVQPAATFQQQQQPQAPQIRPAATFMQPQQQSAQPAAAPFQQRAPAAQAIPWKPSVPTQQQPQTRTWMQGGGGGGGANAAPPSVGVSSAVAAPPAAAFQRAAPANGALPISTTGGNFMSAVRPMQPGGGQAATAAQRPWPPHTAVQQTQQQQQPVRAALPGPAAAVGAPLNNAQASAGAPPPAFPAAGAASAAAANPWASVQRVLPLQQQQQQPQQRPAPFSSAAASNSDASNSRPHPLAGQASATVAPPAFASAPAPAAAHPWARATPSAAVQAAAMRPGLGPAQPHPYQPQQQQQQHTPTRPTGPSAAAAAWSGEHKSGSAPSSANKAADAAFMSRFVRPGAAVSPIKGGGGGSAASSSGSAGGPASLPALTPLCQGHGLPMLYLTSRKAESAGKKYFTCPLTYSAPNDKCRSFVWETDVLAPGHRGFKIATRGANGDLQQEISLSFEIVSETRFSVQVVPPCAEVTEMLKAEGGEVDEAAMATMNAYAQANPCVFTFPLQKHDPLVHKLNDRKREHPAATNWIVMPVPERARKALMEDLALENRAALGGFEADHEENEASALVSESLSQRPSGGGGGAAAASSSAAAARRDDGDDEDAPIVRRGAGAAAAAAGSKKKKGSLLQTKTQRQKDETRLTPQEEGELNIQKLPPSLRNALLPFQFEGVKYLVSKHGRGLLADEMGLGKTIQAIAVASYYNHDWPLLVICPSSLRFNWQDEIMRWLPFLNRERIFVVKSVKAGEAVLAKDPNHKDVQGREFGILIFSIDIAASLGPQLKQRKFQCVIVDESHMIKSAKAKRTKAVLPLLKTAKRAILLSGTPALNRPEELYTQIHALQPGLFPQHMAFGLRYCAGVKAAFGNGMDFKGSSHLRELHVLLKKYLLIRREKMQVLKQLPAKRRQAVMVDVPESVCRSAKKEVEQLHGSLDEALRDGMEGAQRKPALMKLWQTTGTAKLKAVKEYMQDLIDANIKFLVFGHHKAVLDELDRFVRSRSMEEVPSYIRIDGSTSADDRQANVEKFQKEEGCRIALLSIMAAGTGITLHAASHVVFAELHWTPAYLVQAEDRVHRIGQHFPVNIHYVLGRNTFDDNMWPIISRKLESIGRAVSGQALSMNIDETTNSRTDYDQSRIEDFMDNDDEAAAAAAAAEVDDGDEAAKFAGDEVGDGEDLFSKPAPGSATKRPRPSRKHASPRAGSSSVAAAAAATDDDADDFDIDMLTPQANRSSGASASGSGAAAGTHSPSVQSSGSSSAAASAAKPARPASSGFRIRRPMMVTKSPAMAAAATASASPSVPRSSAKSSSPAPARAHPPSPLVTPSSSQHSRPAVPASASPKPTPPSSAATSSRGSGGGGGGGGSDELQIQSTPETSQSQSQSQEVGPRAATTGAGGRRRKRIAMSDEEDEDAAGPEVEPAAAASAPSSTPRSQSKKRKRHYLFDKEPDQASDDDDDMWVYERVESGEEEGAEEEEEEEEEQQCPEDGEAERDEFEIVEPDDSASPPRPPRAHPAGEAEDKSAMDEFAASDDIPAAARPVPPPRARVALGALVSSVPAVVAKANTADADDDFLDD